MKQSIKNSLRALLAIPVLTLVVSAAAPLADASALPAASQFAETFDRGISDGADSAQGKDQSSSLFGDESGETGVFVTITNILLFIIGAVAVIMLVIGGVRYTVSGGDSNAVSAAKNTILYAIIGIVVAILAYAIVNFVIKGLVATS